MKSLRELHRILSSGAASVPALVAGPRARCDRCRRPTWDRARIGKRCRAGGDERGLNGCKGKYVATTPTP